MFFGKKKPSSGHALNAGVATAKETDQPYNICASSLRSIARNASNREIVWAGLSAFGQWVDVINLERTACCIAITAPATAHAQIAFPLVLVQSPERQAVTCSAYRPRWGKVV